MGETMQLTAADGHAFGAYRASPDGRPKGGVVVIQEIFGVNGHIRSVCDRYAAAGYRAIAPALYDRAERNVELGYTKDDIARGREIRGKLGMADVLKDVEAAAKAAAEAGKVGIVGYCWGGLVVYVAACRLGSALACGSGYYGANIKQYLDEKPAIPLMLHFGAKDQSIPLDEVEQIRTARPEVAVHVYDGADHGFNCDQRSQYHAAAAKIAEDRTLRFFADHIGQGQ